jgi:TonB family protein
MKLRNIKVRRDIALLLLFASVTIVVNVRTGAGAVQQPDQAQLEKKFWKDYASLQEKFADGPEPASSPADHKEKVAQWQDELAARFARTAATADEIIKLNPPNVAMWREQRDTLLLYAQPVSAPESRSVFGAGEVQKKARVFKAPLPVYSDAARAAKAKGEVRLRLVLRGDGKVKYIFAVKPAKHGLTEAAIEAARLMEFEPAIREGRRVSQFATFVYEFKDGQALPPKPSEREF